jgi:flagellar motor switch protein FliN/FliY
MEETKARELDVEIVIELGRTRISIDKLLNMREGTLIELGKPVDELDSITVNGQEIGKGEVVVVEENFGVRMVDKAGNRK